MAKHFGYSPDHINRICKRNCGVGAKTLINNFLLARAKELLCNTEKYVKEIAAELAFPSVKACKNGCHKIIDGKHFFDRANCTACGDCLSPPLRIFINTARAYMVDYDYAIEREILTCILVKDTVEQYKTALDFGCKMFTSDDPKTAIEVLKTLGKR